MRERETGLPLIDGCMNTLRLGHRTSRRSLMIACNLRLQPFLIGSDTVMIKAMIPRRSEIDSVE